VPNAVLGLQTGLISVVNNTDDLFHVLSTCTQVRYWQVYFSYLEWRQLGGVGRSKSAPRQHSLHNTTETPVLTRKSNETNR